MPKPKFLIFFFRSEFETLSSKFQKTLINREIFKEHCAFIPPLAVITTKCAAQINQKDPYRQCSNKPRGDSEFCGVHSRGTSNKFTPTLVRNKRHAELTKLQTEHKPFFILYPDWIERSIDRMWPLIDIPQ